MTNEIENLEKELQVANTAWKKAVNEKVQAAEKCDAAANHHVECQRKLNEALKRAIASEKE